VGKPRFFGEEQASTTGGQQGFHVLLAVENRDSRIPITHDGSMELVYLAELLWDKCR